MEQKEILEGNVKIAEFMELIYKNDVWYFPETWRIEFIGAWSNSLRFHKSWDWLMPAVEKCRKVAIDTDHEFSYVEALEMLFNKFKRTDSYRSGEWFNSIESVWISVIQFIDWYNLNVTTNPIEDNNKSNGK
jgi:hypothetical protein